MTDADLLAAWPLSDEAPLPRFAAFFATLAARGEPGVSPDWSAQSLGACNRQLARLHEQVVGRPVEAVVTCACGEELEVVLPREAVAAAPEPASRVRISAPGTRWFRLPHLSDLSLAGDPLALAARCALDEGGPVPEAFLPVLDAAWTSADPAAEIQLTLACTACGETVEARADLALFVARDLDWKVRGLLAEIHALAGAYGWTEAEVLAVPAPRRRAYGALIAADAP